MRLHQSLYAATPMETSRDKTEPQRASDQTTRTTRSAPVDPHASPRAQSRDRP